MELGLDDVLEGDAASGAETYGTTGHRRSEATSGSRLRTHDRSREREARTLVWRPVDASFLPLWLRDLKKSSP